MSDIPQVYTKSYRSRFFIIDFFLLGAPQPWKTRFPHGTGSYESFQIRTKHICEMLRQEGLFRHDFVWSPYCLRAATSQESPPISPPIQDPLSARLGHSCLLEALWRWQGFLAHHKWQYLALQSVTPDQLTSQSSATLQGLIRVWTPKNAELREHALQTKKFSLRIENTFRRLNKAKED